MTSSVCVCFVINHGLGKHWTLINASRLCVLTKLKTVKKTKFAWRTETGEAVQFRHSLNNKFASRIKNIHSGFIHVHRCVVALYTRYFPELCEKNQDKLLWWDSITRPWQFQSSVFRHCLTSVHVLMFKTLPALCGRAPIQKWIFMICFHLPQSPKSPSDKKSLYCLQTSMLSL